MYIVHVIFVRLLLKPYVVIHELNQANIYDINGHFVIRLFLKNSDSETVKNRMYISSLSSSIDIVL